MIYLMLSLLAKASNDQEQLRWRAPAGLRSQQPDRAASPLKVS
jgi:hypothetical protein